MSYNQELKEKLDAHVFGHEVAKKTLITMLTRSRMRHYQKYIKEMDEEMLLKPMKVLLVGASGTGKTHLLESLRKSVHFPLVRLDATQLNPAGSSGGVKVEDVYKLIVKAASAARDDMPWLYPSLEGAVDKTVVFIDEFDKLGTSFESSGNWNKHVQSNFLTTIDNKRELAGVSFVFAGAFSGITAIEEGPTKQLGFAHAAATPRKKGYMMSDEDIMKSGLIPEIVGRLSAICELDKFTKDEYKRILLERIIPAKQRDLAAYHVFDTELTDGQIEDITTRAEKSGQGIRFMQREVDKVFLDLEFNADAEHIMWNGE